MYTEDLITNEATSRHPLLSHVKSEKPVKIMHHHDSYEILFIIESDNHLYVKGECYELLSRQLVFFAPALLHTIVCNNSSEYRRVSLNFNADFVEDILNSCNCLDVLDVFNMDAGQANFNIVNLDIHSFNIMNGYIAELQEAYKDHMDRQDKYSMTRLKLNLCTFLVRIYELCKSGKNERVALAQGNLVVDVTDFLDAHYMENITLPMLSAKFHVSESYISRKFSKATGMTIVEYLQHRRILEAQKMLTDPAVPISEICYDNGFNNIQHFYRTFKKVTGITPSKWRTMMS